MLSIRVGDNICLMSSEQVQHIDYVNTVTVLPFSSAPIEGLTYFNGQPLLQIDVASVLGLKQNPPAVSKRLIVSTVQGRFALRVDDVLNVVTKTDKTQQAQRLLPLQLSEILPMSLRIKKSAMPLKQVNKPVPHAMQQTLTVLLVTSGSKIIALLTHNIDHIQNLTGLSALDGQSIQGDLLIRVKDQLLPTHSLAQLLGLKEVDTETIAVIVRREQATWALRVQRVIAIETIQQVYSSGTDARGLWYVTQLMDASNHASAPRLWYITKDEQIQEVIDAENLLGMTNAPLAITVVTPQQTVHALPISDRLITNGLQIFCGAGSYLLSLTMAMRTVKVSEISTPTTLRFPTGNRSNCVNRIPWINASALLFGTPNKLTENAVVLSLPDNGQLILGIDRASLSQLASNLEKWSALDLPYPASLFFNAACYDERSEQWTLRVVDTIKFASLPWAIKKSLVKAIIGWFDRQ